MRIEMDDLTIEIIRKPIKNMYLRVHAITGNVSITAPLKFPLKTIHAQIESKRTWIHTARERVLARVIHSPVTMAHGEKHLFLGKPYALVVHSNAQLKGIVIEGECMYGFLESHTLDARKKCLQAWYKKQMQQLIPDLIAKWEPIIGVSVHHWGIKSMKTRWGSCNVVAHRIWLNLNLIQKPLVCLEYVLVHEMVHLLEANHSKRFYAFMTQFMPQWKDHQKLLESAARESHCSSSGSSL